MSGVVSEAGTRWIYRAGYFVGVLCLFFPLVDLLANVWPLRPGDVQWRYGAVGLGSGFVLTPLLGLFLVGLLGVLGGHRRFVLRAVGIVGLLSAVLLALVTGVFVLDAIQVRVAVAEGADRWMFNVAAGRALGKCLLGTLGFGLIGFGGIRAGFGAARSKAASSGASSPKVLVTNRS